MLVSGKELMEHAHDNGYAVGAFNVNNMETVQAIMEAADELQSPVILQASPSGVQYAGVKMIAAMVRAASAEVRVPVALHLDHGWEFSILVQCLQAGWTSLMIDASHCEFDENVMRTKQIVDMARVANVGVEAELAGVYTRVDQAYDFVCATGVDYLAIAVGTAHGSYQGEPKIDFDRIAEIKRKLNMPLVLHGSSGVPDASLKKAIAAGINKINIDQDLQGAYHQAVKTFLMENPQVTDPRLINEPGRAAMKEVVKNKMRIFASVNQAWR